MKPFNEHRNLEPKHFQTQHLSRTQLRMLHMEARFPSKTVAIANMILNSNMYNDEFGNFLIFSWSVHHNGTWEAVTKYVGQEVGKDSTEHPFDPWDSTQLQYIRNDQVAILRWQNDNMHKHRINP